MALLFGVVCLDAIDLCSISLGDNYKKYWKVHNFSCYNPSLWTRKEMNQQGNKKRQKTKKKKVEKKKKQNNTRISYRFHIRYPSTLSHIVDQLGVLLFVWDVLVWGVFLWKVGQRWFI